MRLHYFECYIDSIVLLLINRRNSIFLLLINRIHTLAYVASSGQLYSFGGGDSGQLGNNKVASVNSPVLVQKSWVSDTFKGDNMPCVIWQIAAGGDQCFVLTAEKVNGLKLKELFGVLQYSINCFLVI